MCTISVFRGRDKLVVTGNRDELRTRQEAGLQEISHEHGRMAYPLDGQARGTWMAANDDGWVACLLNLYEADYQGRLSRGLIIPRLMQFTAISDARHWLANHFPAEDYSAFILLLIDRREVYRCRWDGCRFEEGAVDFDRWYLESSSSVDATSTRAYRQALFRQWQNTDGDIHNILDFHLQRIAGNASQSVCMAREMSHTKSITQASVSDTEGLIFRYLDADKLEGLVNSHGDARHHFQTVCMPLLRRQREQRLSYSVNSAFSNLSQQR